MGGSGVNATWLASKRPDSQVTPIAAKRMLVVIEGSGCDVVHRFDERIWLRSSDATGPSQFATTVASSGSSVAVRCEAIAEMSK
jgi:hypothetical protein